MFASAPSGPRTTIVQVRLTPAQKAMIAATAAAAGLPMGGVIREALDRYFAEASGLDGSNTRPSGDTANVNAKANASLSIVKESRQTGH